jgi:hypothetical protein
MPESPNRATTICLRGYIMDDTPRKSLITPLVEIETRFPQMLKSQVCDASSWLADVSRRLQPSTGMLVGATL